MRYLALTLVVLGGACGNGEQPVIDATPGSDAPDVDAPVAPDASIDAQIDAPVDAPIDAPPASHRIFLTSSTHNGNLGGIAGADAICQALAAQHALGGQWRAHLSTTGVRARDRLPATGRFVRVSGLIVATSRDALLAGQLEVAVLVDEGGAATSPSLAWTGSTTDGTPASGAMCQDWTTSSATLVNGTVGDGAAHDATWQSLQTIGCARLQRLYCFEQ